MVKVKIFRKSRKGNAGNTDGGIRVAGGGTSSDYSSQSGHAAEADHASTATRLDADSPDWQTIDSKDAAALAEAKAYSDTQDKAQDEANEKKFLRKDIPDTASGLITFLKGLTSDGLAAFLKGISVGAGGKWGISEEGVATLKSLFINGEYGITKDGMATLAKAVADELRSSDFKAGYLDGSGFAVYKDADKRSVVEADKLVVRMKAVFAELEIRKLSYVGGDQVKSFAGSKLAKVVPVDAEGSEVTDGSTPVAYKCYYIDDDGTTRTQNWWQVGDQARCQTFDIDAGTYKDISNRYYWRLVTAVGSEDVAMSDGTTRHMGFVTLSNTATGFTLTNPDTNKAYTDTDGNDIVFIGMDNSVTNDAPAPDDTIVQLGSQLSSDRSYAIIDYVTGQRTSYYYGINGYTLDGHEVQRLSPHGSWTYTQYFEMRVGGPDSWHPMTDYRGDWMEGTEYTYYNTVTHDGLLWMQSRKGYVSKGEEPNIFSEVWTCVSDGGNAIRIEFESSKGNVVYVNDVDLVLTAHLMFGQKNYDNVLLQSVNDLRWTRDSSVESEDKSWAPTTGATANVLIISHHVPARSKDDRRDLGSQWEERLQCAFTFSAKIYPAGDISRKAASLSETATISNQPS